MSAVYTGMYRVKNKVNIKKGIIMKKIIYITVLLIVLAMWCGVSLAQEKWHEGIIDKITETTITIDKVTYNITSYSIVMDENEDEIDISRLPRCCEKIKFTLIGSDIEKLMFNVSESRW